MDKVVLVTGGAGYVGSHACKALSQAGYLPVVYDNLSTGHEWAVRWGPLEQGDILDRPRLDEVFAAHRPLAVMHFAAKAVVSESVAKPTDYYRNNMTGSLTLLDAICARSAVPLVFSSTCATYGMPRTPLLAEDHVQEPINPYGWSKLMVERMLWDLEPAKGLKAVALRYFNAAGADRDTEIGEVHDPEPHLIPNVLAAAGGQQNAITIFGEDYDTPDGTAIRDYIHVEDLASAHVAALDYLLGGGDSVALNLGTGTGVSVRQIIEVARRMTQCDIPVASGARRPGDPPRLVADARKAEQVLGWRPQRSDLETIIANAWAWHCTTAPTEAESPSANAAP